MTQEMKTNTQGIKLCKECGLHPEKVLGLCRDCNIRKIKEMAAMKRGEK